MTFYYTALEAYAEGYDEGTMSWPKYVEWSRLSQLTELVSVDGMLNNQLVEPDTHNAEDWNYIVVTDVYATAFYTSMDYVFRLI